LYVVKENSVEKINVSELQLQILLAFRLEMCKR